jgi:calcium/calmodulin-dependent protein kinase I
MDQLDKGDYGDKFSSFFLYYKDLGEGSYGKVVKALDRYTGHICAVKIIKKRNLTEAQVKELRQEAAVLSSLNHPNIVKFIAVKESNTRIFIIMEYVRGGTLGSYMKTKKMTEKKSNLAMTGILRAVEYLHSNGIVHRDLKPDNILILNSHNLSTVKIADFGLSTQIDKGSKVDERCGTILYMAPEQAANKAYSKEVDIWSCGIILFKLLNKGSHPLYTLHESKEAYFLKLQNPKWVFPKRFPSLAMNLILNLTKTNPIERYTASQALAHPWITGEDKEIPKTYLELMRIYDAEIKLRSIFFACMFAALVLPEETRFAREPKKVEFMERRKTFSAKAKKPKEPSPRIKHFKTFYDNFYSKSPIRPYTGKQRVKIK